MAVVISDGELRSIDRSSLSISPSTRRGSISLYSGLVQDYATIYRTQPNVRLCVRFLARNIASLPLKGFRRVSAAERLELESGHDLARFVKSPTPSAPKPVSRHRWIRALVEDYAIFDSFFVLKVRNPETGRLNGFRLPPQNVTPIGDSWLWPEGFLVEGNRGRKIFAPGDVIHVFGHNPEDPRTGLSSLEALRQTLAGEHASAEWREQYWRGSARMSGVIERPADAPKWSDTARERFRSGWQGAYASGGDRAGETPILEDGMTFRDVSFSAKDSEYLASRRLTREECAAQFFIPPAFVGILENANFANMREQHVGLYVDTLGPWLDLFEGEFELQLLPEFDDVDDVYLEFALEAKLRGSFEEQASAIQSATGAPWQTRNEARARMNLPPVEGGDELVVPLNVLVGGQASPNDTDTSGELGSLSRTSSPTYRKARAELRGWEAKHAEILETFFARQRSSVLSKLGAGIDLEPAFDRSRWDGELADDLFALAATMAADVGGSLASSFDAELDVDRLLPWLRENARIAAEGVNAATFDALALAWSGVPRRGEAGRKRSRFVDEALAEAGLELDLSELDDELEDPLGGDSFLDPARGVFDARTATIATIAATRTTTVGQWSRKEAASQVGLRSKTWISSGSPNSRHSALDGETVPLGDTFSNGGQWPGDPALGVDETAGCQCSLDFGQ